MSEEEKKAIEYLEEYKKYCEEQIKIIETLDTDAYDEEIELYRNRANQFNIVLKTLEKYKNMYEAEKRIHVERNRQIEDYEKWNDNAKAEIVKLKAENEKWQDKIEQAKKDVKGLKMYEMGIAWLDMREDLDKADKIIDLMVGFIDNNLKDCLINVLETDEPCKSDRFKGCKDCIKQYFEEKVENGEE